MSDISERQPKEAVLDWKTMPGTAKEKLAVLRRQVRREVEAEMKAEFEPLVIAEADRRIEDAIKRIESRARRADLVLKNRTGAFTKAQYNLIRAALDPDNRASLGEEHLAEVFRLFSEANIPLVSKEEDRARSAVPLPTKEELLERRKGKSR